MSLSTTVSGVQTPEMSTVLMSLFTNKYIESTTELPEPSGLQPDESWQPSKEYFSKYCKRDYNPYFVNGWIDIIGFRNMAKINDTYYLNESPSKAVIIQYKTNVCSLGYPRYKGGWNYKLETYEQDNKFVARLTATAVLYYYYDGIMYYDNITKVFYDYEPLPERFISPGNQQVLLKQYNGTIFKPKVLNFNISPGIISYSVNATNGSLKQYVMFGTVEFTNKNVPFMNLTKTDYFIKKGKDISRLNHEITFTSNLTDITFKTPFNTVNANITSRIMPATSVNPAIFGILFIVIVFLGGIYVMANCR